MTATARRQEAPDLYQDVEEVAKVQEGRKFREYVVFLGGLTPPLRRIASWVDSSWQDMSDETKRNIGIAYDRLGEFFAFGAPRRHPTHVFDRIWLTFSDDVRVGLWEFAEAAGRFSGAVERAMASDAESLWEKVKADDPDFAAVHERSVAAIERGDEPIRVDQETLRPIST